MSDAAERGYETRVSSPLSEGPGPTATPGKASLPSGDGRGFKCTRCGKVTQAYGAGRLAAAAAAGEDVSGRRGMIDYTSPRVTSWSQSVINGERWPTHQVKCIARTSENRDLQMTGGPSIRTLGFHMSLIRGQYVPTDKERPLERGVGILAFSEEREAAPPDYPHMDAFCYGWWWMPVALYDETWSQVKLNTF